MAGLIGLNISVDLVKTAAADIQGSLDTIETGLKPIKIDLEIDDKALKGINQQIEKMGTNLDKASQGKGATGSSASINQTTNALKGQSKELEALERSYAKIHQQTATFDSDGNKIAQTMVRMNDAGEKLNIQMDGLGNPEKWREVFPEGQMRKQNQRIEEGISKIREISQFDLSRFRQQMHGLIPPEMDKQLTSISTQMNNVTGTTEGALKQVQGFETELKNVMTSAKDNIGLDKIADQMDRLKESTLTDIELFKDKNADFLTPDDIQLLDQFSTGIKSIEGATAGSKNALDHLTNATRNSIKEMRNRVSATKSAETAEQSLARIQRQSAHNIQMLQSRLSSGVIPDRYMSQFRDLNNQLVAINPTARGAMASARDLSQQINHLSARVMEADRNMSMFKDQMHSAFLRVPIYAATMALLYTPLRAVKDALTQIIEIDTQMTVLERVSNGAIKMNDALESSIEIADRLGIVIGEVNEGLINFARQGYRGDDLSAMTEVATMMANVSELNVEDSASALTAAMKGFNIEAENSVRIVDAMNEVNIKSASCYSNVA